MASILKSGNVPPTPVPNASRALAAIINPIYRFFDWLYSSGYNPLYRSGTLACGFLFILLATGLYLSFFYSVSDPYQSLIEIQSQIWLGRWFRALHRYTTVATVIAIAFHVLQLLVQGKNWGPRTLAWISGVVLLLMFFVSAWSGYVMVWDLHGQQVALAGAKLLATIPILHDVSTAAFDGTAPIPPGFFFMNLFLHVALPVMMIMFLWVHTARLSRAVWFPTRPIMIWSTVGLVVLSIMVPAPLLERADLLRTVGRIPYDAATGFWIPTLETVGTIPIWAFMILTTGWLFILPWIWRPKREDIRPRSTVDIEACTGCTQCARDCPYEAIKMVPRNDGRRLIAEINPNHCVSCGICAASCADFAVGPPTRTPTDQLMRAKEFCNEVDAKQLSLDVVMVACSNNTRLTQLMEQQISSQEATAVYPVECCGCLNTTVIEQILSVSRGLALVGCPARNCFNRDGGELLSQRIFEKRVPFLSRSIDRNRLLITTYSEAETTELSDAINRFTRRLKNERTDSDSASLNWMQRARALIVSTLLLMLCATLSQLPLGTDPKLALVRIAGLLPSYSAEKCHAPDDAELSGVPVHMRPKQICDKIPLSYRVNILLDGKTVFDRALDSQQRFDRPITVDLEQQLAPGNYDIAVAIASSDGSLVTRCSSDKTLVPGQIFLAHFDRETAQLVCR